MRANSIITVIPCMLLFTTLASGQSGDKVVTDLGVSVSLSVTGYDTREGGFDTISVVENTDQFDEIPANLERSFMALDQSQPNGGQANAWAHYENGMLEIGSTSRARSVVLPNGELLWRANVVYDFLFTLT